MRWHYTVAAQTDVGTTKTVNQDCLTVKVANTIYGEAAFAVMCDGMGGLEQGEVASTMVVRAYEQWFLRELPQLLSKGLSEDSLRQVWYRLANECNDQIGAAGGTLLYLPCGRLPRLCDGQRNGAAYNRPDLCGKRGCAGAYDTGAGVK